MRHENGGADAGCIRDIASRMRSRGSENPRNRFGPQGRKITDRGQDRGESLGAEARRASGEGRIHADVAGFADDLQHKSCSAQTRLQGRLITDDEDMRQRATQRGQSVERHRPREPAPQGVGYGEPGLGMLDWFERDHRRRRGGAAHHREPVSTGMLTNSSHGSRRMMMLPRSRKV